MSEIRKALEAAGEAARASLASDTTCPQAGGYVCTTPPCSCASDAASAAVAAFLRHYSKLSPAALIYGPAIATEVEKEAGHE